MATRRGRPTEDTATPDLLALIESIRGKGHADREDLVRFFAGLAAESSDQVRAIAGREIAKLLTIQDERRIPAPTTPEQRIERAAHILLSLPSQEAQAAWLMSQKLRSAETAEIARFRELAGGAKPQVIDLPPELPPEEPNGSGAPEPTEADEDE